MTAHMKQKRYVSLWTLRIGLALLIPQFGLHAQLNQNCTVSILNRTVPVDANGNWLVTGVPVGFSPVRARATCVNNGTVSQGQSGLFTLTANQATGFDATMILGVVQPIPDALTVAAPANLSAIGATSQLTVSAHYPAGTTSDVTAASSGTIYTTSNSGIATVSADGLVQAIASGTVIIQVTNEGTSAMTSIHVVLNATDSDHDGIPDDVEIQNGLNPHDPTDALQDADGDGLTNLEEYRLGTNMRKPDTDGDGIRDLDELRLGLNPLVIDVTTTVQGRVVDSSSNPVSAITVTVFGILTATTEATGAFQFKSVPAGLGNIAVSASGQVSGQVVGGMSPSVSAVPGGITDVGSITITQQPDVVTGVISDPQGRLVSGAVVSIYSLDNGGVAHITSTLSGNDGGYRLSIGQAFQITVNAFDPRTAYIGQVITSFPTGSGLISVPVTVGPIGAVQGKVYHSDGTTPYAFVPIREQYSGNGILTASDGSYSFVPLPAGPFRLIITDPVSFHSFSVSSATPLGNGETRNLDIVDPGVGLVQVTVKDSSGNLLSGIPVKISSNTQFVDASTNTLLGAGPAEFRIVAGGFTVTASDSRTGTNASATGTAISSGTTVIVLQFQATLPGTVGGTITYDGSTPVSYPYVFITQTDSTGQVHTYYPDFRSTTLDGKYVVTGVGVGPFTLTAQADSGLSTSVDGTVVSLSQAVTADATMPPTATVNGTVLTSTGVPVPNTDAGLSAPTLPYIAEPQNTQFSFTDAQGNFTMHVPPGPFIVFADSGTFFNYLVDGSNAGIASQAGTTVTTNVILPATGVVTGTLFAADGQTVVANVPIWLENFDNSSELGFYEPGVQVQTDNFGKFGYDHVQVGNVQVSALTSSQFGFTNGVLTSQNPTNLNIVLGNTPTYPVSFLGSDGFIYGGMQRLKLGGTASGQLLNPYANGSYALLFNVAGNLVRADIDDNPYRHYYRTELNGQQIGVVPSYHALGLAASRKVFVPTTGGFVRFLDTITNTTTVALTLPIRVDSLLYSGSGGTELHVNTPPSATGNTYALTDSTVCCYPALGHVFAGSNPPVPVSTTKFVTGDNEIYYEWNLTIQPGQSISLMHFAIQRDTTNLAGAQTQAQGLAALTDPNAVFGMTAAEKAQVVNFRIP
jgi:hypothetical protein